ncbi:MAG: type VI secretion system baseplate subunit TssG [Methylovirgula sp.]
MAPETRSSEAALAESGLDQQIAGKSFFALALALEKLFSDAPAFGTTVDPAREKVRFRANPTFGFPAEEVAKIEPRPGSADGLDVTVNFLGLYGPSSPLPPLYTERVISAESEGSPLTKFLDFFHHRLIALIVQIWKHHRYYLRYRPGASDATSASVAALFGLPPHGLGARGETLRQSLLPYAGLLSLYSRSASIISHIISHSTGVATRIEEFIPRQVRIPEPQLTRLGVGQASLGEDFILGEEIDDDFGKFRVVIGPLTRAGFEQLLPGEPDFLAIDELIRLSTKDPLEFEHALVLGAGEAPIWQLGKARLGWTTWLDPLQDRELAVVL